MCVQCQYTDRMKDALEKQNKGCAPVKWHAVNRAYLSSVAVAEELIENFCITECSGPLLSSVNLHFQRERNWLRRFFRAFASFIPMRLASNASRILFVFICILNEATRRNRRSRSRSRRSSRQIPVPRGPLGFDLNLNNTDSLLCALVFCRVDIFS